MQFEIIHIKAIFLNAGSNDQGLNSYVRMHLRMDQETMNFRVLGYVYLIFPFQ